MAKGQAAKQEVAATILSAFPDSFLYNDGKEIRINTVEDGSPVQIKVALTAAKVIVSEGDDNAVPGAVKAAADKASIQTGDFSFEGENKNKIAEPSADEIKAVNDFMAALDL